jgi:phosphoglycolate phosphatase
MITDCIFDFDGTLVDSLEDVLDSLKAAFVTAGIKANTFNVEEIMQQQLKEAVEKIAPGITAEQTEKVMASFRKIYDSIDYPKTALKPGAAELLPKLKEKSIGIYIVSNKRHVPTVRILDKFGLRHFFIDILNPDLHGLQKPTSKPQLLAMLLQKHAIDNQHAVYVGDSQVDVTAARENGLVSFIVANGYGKVDGFSVKPDHQINTLTGVLDYC